MICSVLFILWPFISHRVYAIRRIIEFGEKAPVMLLSWIQMQSCLEKYYIFFSSSLFEQLLKLWKVNGTYRMQN